MRSSVWKKTADGLPPAEKKTRYVLAVSKDSDGFPVVEGYVFRPYYGGWRHLGCGYFPLEQSLYWAYEDELALSVLGEY